MASDAPSDVDVPWQGSSATSDQEGQPMTTAGYYDQSYPPSVWQAVFHAHIASGVDGGRNIIGQPVTVVLVDGQGNPVPPTAVDWGDGTQNTLLTHTYSVAAVGVVIRVATGAGGLEGNVIDLPAFDVREPIAEAASVDTADVADVADYLGGDAA